jgi:GNAT superfamily N-acetyltransferase
MANLEIQRVATARQKKLFLEFPWELYRDDPCWVPPLRDNQKELVNYKPHPFYARSRIQTFLAMRGGEVVGRVAAILNHWHNIQYNERRGFFGFFECRDDREAAHGLFDAVRGWFSDQGIFHLRGPMNPSMNYELGLLIEGFDSLPTFMMTYNRPYYQRLIEDYGFRKAQDMYAFWGQLDMLPPIVAKLEPIAEQVIERYNVKIRTLDTKRFREDVRMFLSLYNQSFSNMWGFVPMTPAEIEHMASGLRWLISPDMAIAAEVEGKVVGASFGMPDYNPRIKEIDGRLFPFGFVKLLRNKRAIKKIRLISTNVLPEYQRFGIGLVLMHGLMPRAMDWGLEEAEFSWVLESNSLSFGSLKKGGAKISKTYRLFDLEWEDEEGQEGRGERGEGRESARLLPVPISGSRSLVPSRGPLEIREVRTGADLRRFIRLPWRIYEGDPHWIPPLVMEVKAFLDRRKHPFYKHGEATQFIALRGGETVGRILVSDDPNYNRQWKTNLGCFGMFESIDDPETAHALLDAAAGWLRGRGRAGIMGPIDYSTNYPCGLLVDGFDTPPRVMMNHNPRCYGRLLESWGLAKCKDLYCWWFVDPHDLTARWRERLERIAKRSGVTVRTFNNADFDAEVRRCREIYNASMNDNWGFVRLTEDEFRAYAKQLSRIAQEDQVLIAEVEGQPVGISITLPDINEAIQPLNGRLTTWGLPLGLLKLARNMRRIRTARMMILDVLEGYRRRGVAELLILRTLDFGKNVLHYDGAELGWTLEDNRMVSRTIEAVGGRRYKTYRIYEKAIGEE